MNLCFRVLHRLKCKNTHHKLALDALRHFSGAGLASEPADRWADAFLWHIEPYLTGSKAPDTTFKDFTNHVLHPEQNGWGGAPRAAGKWYRTAVEQLRTRDWAEGIYAAGVMGHYLTDPFMPLHTGQDPAEANVHRACEWSVYKCYDTLVPPEAPLAPPFPLPNGDDWLEQLIREAAETSHRDFRLILDRFDFHAAAKNPPAGLNDELRTVFARILQRTAAALGGATARLLLEAGTEPPAYPVGLAGALAIPAAPVFVATKAVADHRERRTVAATYAEFRTSGRVVKTLTEDVRVVRETCERERGTAERHTASPPNFTIPVPPRVASRPPAASAPHTNRRLAPGDPVEAAPSIGPKTAKRLAAVGIHTVADLLAADPITTSARLDVGHIKASDITEWQLQARLCCDVSGLYGHDAQLLVACGVTSAADLAALSPIDLWELVVPVAESPDGKRLLRGSQPPDLDEVTRWITAAHGNRRAA